MKETRCTECRNRRKCYKFDVFRTGARYAVPLCEVDARRILGDGEIDRLITLGFLKAWKPKPTAPDNQLALGV